MKIGPELIKLLSKIFEPNTMVERKFKGNDVAFKTDDDGKPILLFVGERQSDGQVKGDRFARRFVIADDGTVIKDHWDYKGKAS